MVYLYISIWFIILISLSALSRTLLQFICGGRGYRYLFFLGEIAFELSYACGCYLSGATITRLKLLDEAEEVQHTPSPIPFLGPLFISLSPLLGCSLLLILFIHLCGFTLPDAGGYLQHSYELSIDGGAALLNDQVGLVKTVLTDLLKRENNSLLAVLLAYLTVNFCIFIAPTAKELGFAALGIAVAGLALFALDSTQGGLQWTLAGVSLTAFLYSHAAFMLAMNLVFIAAALIALGIVWLVKAFTGSSGAPKAKPSSQPNPAA